MLVDDDEEDEDEDEEEEGEGEEGEFKYDRATRKDERNWDDLRTLRSCRIVSC